MASDTQWARWSSSSSNADRLEGLGGGRHLFEDLDAVPVLVHHALQASDLAFYPPQPLLDRLFVVDVSRSHGASTRSVANTPLGYQRWAGSVPLEPDQPNASATRRMPSCQGTRVRPRTSCMWVTSGQIGQGAAGS